METQNPVDIESVAGPEALPTDLTPDDYNQAVDRMQRDLALIQLKRRIQQPGLNAAAVLEIVRNIEQLQALAEPTSG